MVNATRNDDGSVDITFKLSPEMVDQLQKAASSQESFLGHPLLKWEPLMRKAKYCIDCNDGRGGREIEAYGDAHAIAIGFAMCGSFSMKSGRCKPEH